MLASTSRPMPAKSAAQKSGRAVAVGGSNPTRTTTTAARSSNSRRRRRRLHSSPPVGALRSTPSAATTTVARASSSDALPSALPPAAGGSRKRVVILGGTGRVGASTALQLVKGPGGDQLDLVLVGKPGGETPAPSSSSFSSASAAVSAACAKVPALAKAIVAVAAVDSSDVEGLARLFGGASCVIHCAGPFQSGGAGAARAAKAASKDGEGGARGAVPAPLAAAIRARVPYVDVCDDPDWAKLALSADADARMAGIPAITTAGVFPGLSGLMASHMCAVSRLESAPLGVRVAPRDDGEAARARVAAGVGAGGGSDKNSPPPPASASAPSSSVLTAVPTSIPAGATPSEPSRLRYSYFVAGSGGAGPAVLAATLLLAGRDAAAWKDGAKVSRPAFSEPLPADFGRFVGTKTVYLIDLPEVEAAAVDLRVPSVSARFATAPGAFNLGTVLLARLLPKSVLADRGFAARAAGLLAPLVAAADAAMGVLPVAIRVDLELKKEASDGDGGGGGGGSTKPPPRGPRDRRRDDPFLLGDDEQASSSAFVHRDMATAVGACTAAFAREVLRLELEGGGDDGSRGDGDGNERGAGETRRYSVPPGVCRPEALPGASRERILRDVAENSGAARFEVGAPPWALDSEPTRLGMGMYW